MSNRDLRERVVTFSKQMVEWDAAKAQQERAMSDKNRNEMTKIPREDRTRLDEVWNRGVQETTQFYSNYSMEFNRDFAATAAAYRDELLRRLGPQPTPTAPRERSMPLVFTGWVTPMSVPATAIYLQKLAVKLP